jgi:hypothetical protein
MRWEGHVARMGNKGVVCRVLVGKPGEKGPLGRPRRGRDESSGSGIWRHGMNRSGTGQGKLAGACECVNELSGSIKCGEFLD